MLKDGGLHRGRIGSSDPIEGNGSSAGSNGQKSLFTRMKMEIENGMRKRNEM
jgi:hypothetical protein